MLFPWSKSVCEKERKLRKDTEKKTDTITGGGKYVRYIYCHNNYNYNYTYIVFMT